jgi:hypothetical protein
MAHRDDEVIVSMCLEKFTDVFGKNEDVHLVSLLEIIFDVFG